jgi:lipoate-protein ligase A
MDTISIWQILDTRIENASFNMALDEILLERSLKGVLKAPLFRFYGWDKPSISVGRYQSIQKDIRVDNCQRDQIPLVRRPTGGRAVFHDKELTYSVIIPANHPWAQNSLMVTFAMISQILVEGMNNIGLEVDFEKQAHGIKSYPHQASCFASITPYEVTLQGIKIIGSAQYRHQGAILQQGSVLISINPSISDYFNTLDILHKGINDIVNVDVTYDMLKLGILKSLQSHSEDSLLSYPLNQETLESAQNLAKTKYSSDNWTFYR